MKQTYDFLARMPSVRRLLATAIFLALGAPSALAQDWSEPQRFAPPQRAGALSDAPRAMLPSSPTPAPPPSLSAHAPPATTLAAAEQARGEPSAALRVPEPAPLKLNLPEPSRAASEPRPRTGLPSIASVIGSLAIVLGLLALMAWLLKRAMPQAAAPLPSSVVEVLGRVPLAPRQYAHLLRVGNKLVLVSVAGGAAEPLTEITDPVEVDRLAGLCVQAQPNSSSQVFRQVFQQFSAPASESRFASLRRSSESRGGSPLGPTDG